MSGLSVIAARRENKQESECLIWRDVVFPSLLLILVWPESHWAWLGGKGEAGHADVTAKQIILFGKPLT